MKKNILGIVALLLLICTQVWAQPSISCPAVNGGNDTTLACTGCANLTATPVSGNQPTNYTVQQIPYNPYPYNVGTPILVNIDDIYSALLPIGFNFCYYGNTYNQCIVGSNGILSFDLGQANQYCQWPINAAIPSANNPLNCIMGTFQDIDPSIAGTIRWQQYGTAPCRVFVVSFDNIAYFSCTNLRYTGQIAIYETTNIIEVYIQNKPTCAGWNAGAAIQGIHNATGTQAVVVPGRNFPTQWTTNNDAWRFVPSGAPNYTVSWFQAGNPVPISATTTVQVCPSQTTTYYAQAVYTNCNGSTVTVTDSVNVSVVGLAINTNPNITPASCNNASGGAITVNPTGGAGGYTYSWSNGGTSNTITGLSPGTYTVSITDASLCTKVDSFVIPAIPIVTATATPSPALCFGQASGSITIGAGGGNGPYTYQWSPSGSGAIGTNLGAGNYSITVTDAGGCRDTVTATITQPTQVTTQAQMQPASCFGQANGSVSAVASGGVGSYTFFWQPINQAGSSISGLPAGNYTVTAADSNGCTATATVTLTQPTAIAINVSTASVSCTGGSDGSATAAASGGSGGYSYSWSNGSNGPTINNLVAGQYTVTVTDNQSCTNTSTVTVLEPSPLTAQASGTVETCANFCDATISVVANGGTPNYTYAWSNGSSSSTVQGVCAGAYSVTVTDANGCQTTAAVTVVANPSPSVDAGVNVSFCEGSGGVQLTGTGSGGTAPYYFTWSCANPPCGLDSLYDNDPVANPTDTTLYYLFVTDQNGCPSPLDSVQVNVIPKPSVDAGPDATICGTPAPCTVLTPTVLTGFGPFQYQWIPSTGLNDPALQNPCARPDTTTIYTLVITDLATGCTSDFNTLDTVSTVTITVNPVPVADAGPDRIVCLGDSAMLTGVGTSAGPVYDYEWSPATGLSNPNVINPMASPPSTTTYFLTVWSNGCPSIADTVTVFVTEIPTVDAGPNRDICAGETALLDGTASVSNLIIPDSIAVFSWSPSTGLATTIGEDVNASPGQTTLYYLEVTSAYGCRNLDSVLVTVNPSPLPEAGPTITVCEGTGPWTLNGTLTWVNNLPPANPQTIIHEWQPVGFIVGPNNAPTVQVETDSTMYFYYTVTNNTCSRTDSLLVIVLNEVIATATADTNVICEGDSVLLTATGGIGGANFVWTPSTGLANPNSDSTLAAPTSTTTYTVTASEGGCSGSAEVTVSVIPAPQASFTNSFTEGCVPHTVSFTSLTSDGVLLVWDFGDSTPVVNGEQVSHTFTGPGSYEVTLTALTEGACADVTEPLIVTVYDTVQAEFTSSPNFPAELALPDGFVTFNEQSAGGVSFTWNFGDGGSSNLPNPSHGFDQPGEYYVTLSVTNLFGCVSHVTHGPYIVRTAEIFVPNVFSPNGDGINDEFMVNYTGSQPFLLDIFDRWGEKIFSTNNKNDGWAGNFRNAPCADGVYYYTLRVGNREFTGNVTLMR